jgi:hypothetical protein
MIKIARKSKQRRISITREYIRIRCHGKIGPRSAAIHSGARPSLWPVQGLQAAASALQSNLIPTLYYHRFLKHRITS